MRPRRILPISARSVSVAREMKGKSARLRARRMRLEMTMSDSGPEPRSHSPLVWANSCRFKSEKSIWANLSFLVFIACLFDRANFVAQFGCLFVFFRGDGFLHFTAEADELRLLFGTAGAELGHLADVTCFAMNVEQ